MKKTFIALTGLVATVSFAYAAPSAEQGIGTIGKLLGLISNQIISALITLFATGALAAFFFGMVQFILAAREGKQDKMTNGKQFMLWSVIALFVMFSIWGIVNYAQNIFGVTDNTIRIPKILLDGQNSPSPASPGLTPPAPAYYDYNSCVNATGNASTCRSLYPNTSPAAPTPAPAYYDFNSCFAATGDQGTCRTLYPGSASSSNGCSQAGQACAAGSANGICQSTSSGLQCVPTGGGGV